VWVVWGGGLVLPGCVFVFLFSGEKGWECFVMWLKEVFLVEGFVGVVC